MIYPGSQESQDKPLSQDVREGPRIQDQESLSRDGRSPSHASEIDAVGEDDWLRVFQHEIASSGRAAVESAPPQQAAATGAPVTSREVGSPPPRAEAGEARRAAGISRGVRVVRERFARHYQLRRPGGVVGRLMTGLAHSRRSFASLPRRSQRWVLIAGIAGVSAILWGLFAPSSRGPQSASASELLAQVQLSNTTLKRQVQHLSAELQAARTARARLRNEVGALTEERDWLAARLDAVASAGAPVIDGEVPPEPHPRPATSARNDEPAIPVGDSTPAGDYEVGKGDTLWSIARRHDVDVKQLTAANGIGLTEPLKLGQRLAIPSAGSSSAVGAEKSAEKVAADKVAPSKEKQVEYTVKRGDSLYAISRQFDVSVEQLQAWNSLGKRAVLQPSQRLIVYVKPAADATAMP